MKAKQGYVIYDDTIDNIIKEEVSRSKDNLSEAFRKAAERVNAETDQNVTKEKLSARYYAKLNVKSRNQTEKFVSSSNGSRIKISDTNYLNELAEEVVNKMPKKDRVSFIRSIVKGL
jgi:hypothetical protein